MQLDWIIYLLRKIFRRFRFPFLNNFQTAIHVLEKLPQHEVLILHLKDEQNREQCKAAELQQQQLD